MNAIGKSITGSVRKTNEDSIAYLNLTDCSNQNFFVVADGMGGHRSGDVASNTAVQAFHCHITENFEKFDCENELLDLLVKGVQESNERVYEKSLSDEIFEGMGTTLVASIFAKENKTAYFANVGDSRAYFFSSKKLIQLTSDHSFVMEMVKMGEITKEEAETHPKKNIITRALGSNETVEIDTVVQKYKKGDIFLMCSDGLSNMVDDDVISFILSTKNILPVKLDMLMDVAIKNGAIDNISLILIEI